MKITRVEARQFSPEDRASILVFLHTDSEITGVGEASCPEQLETLSAAMIEVESRILGFDPFNVNAIGAMLGPTTEKLCDGILLGVISGVEAACLDIVGKRLGVPVFQLFGGSLRNKVRVCATRWEQLDDSPEDYARKAREISNSGITAIKFDPFGPPNQITPGSQLERVIEISRRIRETVGKDVDLIADAHGRFTTSEAIIISNALEPFGLMWLEDPVKTDDLVSLESLANEVEVPLANGVRMVASNGFRKAIELQLIDFVRIDCQNVGGILHARAIALLAESYYIGFALHHSGGPVALGMNLLVAACAPNLVLAEVPYPPPSWWNRALKEPFEQQCGFLKVPSGPGLGIEYRAEVFNPV